LRKSYLYEAWIGEEYYGFHQKHSSRNGPAFKKEWDGLGDIFCRMEAGNDHHIKLLTERSKARASGLILHKSILRHVEMIDLAVVPALRLSIDRLRGKSVIIQRSE
jgi:hypothetical protein